MAQKLKEELTAVLKGMSEISAKAETEGRDFTDEEKGELETALTRAKSIRDTLTSAARAKALTGEIEQFLADEAAGGDLDEDGLRRKAQHPVSIGEQFVKSVQLKAALDKLPGGQLSAKSAFSMDPVQLQGGFKALVGTNPTGDNTGVGTLIDPQRIATVQATWPELKMRDVVTVGTTDSDSIQYARIRREGEVGGAVNNAAGVPEAVSAAPISATGTVVTPVQAGLKPESAIKFEIKNAPVITVAHWIPATRKALSDAGQLRTLIDNFLRKGLEAELERQMIAGDEDDGEEFNGLLSVSGTQAQAFNTNILVTIRKSLTKVRRYGRANAILMNPANAERIDLLRTSTGAYLGSGAFGPAQTSVWRTPVIEVVGLPDDKVLVGDFTTAILWDREQTQVTVSDSHADFFTRNLLAILAECRAAFAVLDPALIVVASVTGEDDIVPGVTGA